MSTAGLFIAGSVVFLRDTFLKADVLVVTDDSDGLLGVTVGCVFFFKLTTLKEGVAGTGTGQGSSLLVGIMVVSTGVHM